jgi:hypothetical protein
VCSSGVHLTAVTMNDMTYGLQVCIDIKKTCLVRSINTCVYEVFSITGM